MKGLRDIKVTQYRLDLWRGNKRIICVLRCGNCDAIHIFKKKYKDWYINCECGHNLIFACLINHNKNKVLYKSRHMYSDNINHFDIYK